MPKFHFNIRSGDALMRDQTGKALPDIETARDLALDYARRLCGRLAESAEATDDRIIEITDTVGRVIDTLSICNAFGCK